MNRSLSSFRMVLVGLGLSLLASTARAECGDVTGEGDTTASDALAVLRYEVWVGTFQRDVTSFGTLYITELPEMHP